VGFTNYLHGAESLLRS